MNGKKIYNYVDNGRVAMEETCHVKMNCREYSKTNFLLKCLNSAQVSHTS